MNFSGHLPGWTFKVVISNGKAKCLQSLPLSEVAVSAKTLDVYIYYQGLVWRKALACTSSCEEQGHC